MKTNLKMDSNILQIFSFETAKIPKVRAIPAKERDIKKYMIIILKRVTNEMGNKKKHTTMSTEIGMINTIICDKYIPNNRFNRFDGAIIVAGNVSQNFSFRN